MRILLLLVVVALAGASCSHDGAGAKPSDPNVISTTGVVQHQEMEGGFFGLVADDGAKYDPGTLAPEFQKDGLRVRFTARKTGAMTTRMWGTPVAVEKIEKL